MFRTIVLLVTLVSFPTTGFSDFRCFVSQVGNDDWSGLSASPNAEGSEGPFATLERARDEIRRLKSENPAALGKVIVEIEGGIYARSEPFELGAEDGGSPEIPVVYRAYQDEEVRLVGGKILENWSPVTDPTVLERLDPEARGKVLETNLKDLGIEDFGGVRPGGIELFFKEQPMTLSRWPNEGFTNITEITDASPNTIHGRTGSLLGKFYFKDDRLGRWVEETDLWTHGFWFWDWADSYDKVVAIDPEEQLISLAEPYHGYGYRKGARFFVLNALSELDQPGEWKLDRQSGALYFWPPSPIESGLAIVSVLPTLVDTENASNVRFENLTLESARGCAIRIRGGENNTIAGCVIRNVGETGAILSGGENSSILACDVYNTGSGGISLSGGDRPSLTPGNLLAENNHIHHFSRLKKTYAPGVGIGGVGNRVRNNLIHDAPHNAIQLGGNEHLIEFNEVHHVCQETADVGAFYMGRDWTQRGNVVRYNFFHHIGGAGDLQKDAFRDAMSIYLDDWSSGTTIVGNICYKGGRAILIGGGRDNLVENNIFVDCEPAIHVDSRGLGWAKYYFDSSDNTLVERLEKMNYREPPYSEAYPELLTLYDDDPAVAKGNRIVRNIFHGGRWLDLMNGLNDEIVKQEDNFIEGDPGFVDIEKMDFRLKPDSPALSLGFKPIPTEKIGLYEDEFRSRERMP